MAYIFWHSILEFYLASIMTSAFFLESIPTSYLASFLASILTFPLAFYLAFFLIIYLAFFPASLLALCLAFYLTVYSGILSGTYSEILFAILSGMFSDIHSGILSGIYSDILSAILSANLSGMPWTRNMAPSPGPLHSPPSSQCGTGMHWASWDPCLLWSRVRGWGPAVPTEIWSSLLRGGGRGGGASTSDKI